MSAERQGSSENGSDLRKAESLFVDATDYGDIYFVLIGTILLLESKFNEFSFLLSFPLSHTWVYNSVQKCWKSHQNISAHIHAGEIPKVYVAE